MRKRSPSAARRAIRTIVFIATLLAVAAAPAAETPTGTPARTAVARPQPPAYQADLLRLAEVLGTVAYLDPLCNADGADHWRETMARLMDAQHLSAEGQRPYVAAFNRGFRSLTVAHRSCDNRTRLVLDRFFSEGATLADRLEFRFGVAPDAGPAGTGLPKN